jgi:archaemetzincin
MMPKDKIIAVQPFGGVSEDLLEVVDAAVQSIYQIQTEKLPNQPMPEEAYDPRRGQHNCYPVLKLLNKLKPEHAVKIIGVTDVDLFIPILTYVFGEAELGGHATIISTHRLAKDKNGESLPLGQVLERTAKIAIHELAHTFRLPHCKQDGCLMGSFPALKNIDETESQFCRYCQMFLKDEYERLGLTWDSGGHGRVF